MYITTSRAGTNSMPTSDSLIPSKAIFLNSVAIYLLAMGLSLGFLFSGGR